MVLIQSQPLSDSFLSLYNLVGKNSRNILIFQFSETEFVIYCDHQRSKNTNLALWSYYFKYKNINFSSVQVGHPKLEKQSGDFVLYLAQSIEESKFHIKNN